MKVSRYVSVQTEGNGKGLRWKGMKGGWGWLLVDGYPLGEVQCEKRAEGDGRRKAGWRWRAVASSGPLAKRSPISIHAAMD